MPPPPNFSDPAFLRAHAAATIAWWAQRAAPEGGCFHVLRDDGSVVSPEAGSRHLVSSTRLVANFSWGSYRLSAHPDAPAWAARAADCLAFLRGAHRSGAHPHAWAWVVDVGPPVAALDTDNRAYGLSFVLLAHATAARAGVAGAREGVEEAWAALSARFWEPAHSLYSDQADQAYTATRPYRGQNANMHAVEAHMAAFDATGEEKHLVRARAIAEAMCVRQAARVAEACHGHALVYEHYNSAWLPDMEFHKDKPDDRFLPYGFQPGHLMEWAKLLVQLHERRAAVPGVPEAEAQWGWRPAVAARFFAAALRGWDEAHGGLVYSLAPTAGLEHLNARKYSCVLLPTLAAPAPSDARLAPPLPIQSGSPPKALSPRHCWRGTARAWRGRFFCSGTRSCGFTHGRTSWTTLLARGFGSSAKKTKSSTI
jgi:mannose/cellobiose epimerase-like protein (N-acyl-D-glucosamine 2-epimerase family)